MTERKNIDIKLNIIKKKMEIKDYYGGNVQHIKVGDHTKDVQAYLDYYAIVGDDDNGKMMTDAEFEAYKKKVAGVRANHLYVFYVNKRGEECKAIGPSSMCFCKHRFVIIALIM